MIFPECELYTAEDSFYCQCAGCPVVSNSTPKCVLEEISLGTYQFLGHTPSGGCKALFLFSDNEGNPVAKSDAIHVEIREFNPEEKQIGVLFGVIDPEGLSNPPINS